MPAILPLLLAYFFRSNLQYKTYLARASIAIFLLSQIAFDELFEVRISSFSGDLNHAATNTHGPFSPGWINHTDRYAWIALDVAMFLMAFDGVDQNVLSI